MPLGEFEQNIIKDTSIPLPDGGDTHIHPYGPNEQDFVITTRIPVGDGNMVDIHDRPFFPA